MKTVVLYKSKTGFTKKYAEWISEALSADLFNVSKFYPNMLTAYDIVIFGGGLYAVGINGVKVITQNFDKYKDKKVIVFATGVSPVREDGIKEVKGKNFTSDQLKHIRFFYLRGGFDYDRLGFVDKVLMTLLRVSIIWKQKRNKELTSDEIGMLAIYDKPADFTNRSKIDQVVNCAKWWTAK